MTARYDVLTRPSKIERSATLPTAIEPMTSSVAVTAAALIVTIFHSCSSVKKLL